MPWPLHAGSGPRPVPGSARAPSGVLYVNERPGTEAEQMLRAMRAPVQRCSSGRQAIEIAGSQALSCVVATLLLQDMSATALISALRNVAPGLAVIVIVDDPIVSEAVAVMQVGAHAVVDSRMLSTGLFHHVAPLLHGD